MAPHSVKLWWTKSATLLHPSNPVPIHCSRFFFDIFCLYIFLSQALHQRVDFVGIEFSFERSWKYFVLWFFQHFAFKNQWVTESETCQPTKTNIPKVHLQNQVLQYFWGYRGVQKTQTSASSFLQKQAITESRGHYFKVTEGCTVQTPAPLLVENQPTWFFHRHDCGFSLYGRKGGGPLRLSQGGGRFQILLPRVLKKQEKTAKVPNPPHHLLSLR